MTYQTFTEVALEVVDENPLDAAEHIEDEELTPKLLADEPQPSVDATPCPHPLDADLIHKISPSILTPSYTHPLNKSDICQLLLFFQTPLCSFHPQ